MKAILVTGGLGYIGSHTVVELVQAGFKPIIIDNLSNSKLSVLDGIAKITSQKPIFYQQDYTNQKILKDIFSKEGIHGVIHFAAHKAVNESINQPLSYYANNVAGLVSLLQQMSQNNISKFVFSSSCTVYGEPDHLPVTEDAPFKPATSPYGTTKQMGEQIIKDTARANQAFQAIALRYFNPIGAHPSGSIGELPLGTPANLIPFLTQATAGLRPELVVHGNDYPTPDGTCIRDYIHVVDLAKAHVSALNLLTKQQSGFYDAVNVGTGKGTSVLEAIKTFESVNNVKAPYRIGPRRAGDVIKSYANANKAQKLLNWQAMYSLEDALKHAWAWQQKLNK